MSSPSTGQRPSVPTLGICADPTVSVKGNMQGSLAVGTTVGFIQKEVAARVTKTYGLDPALEAAEMRATYFPAVEATDKLGTIGPDGLIALFSPSDEQSRRIQDRVTQMARQEKENLILAASNKQLANSLVTDINQPANKPGSSKKQAKKTDTSQQDIDGRLNEMQDLIQDLRERLEKDRADRKEDVEALRQVTLLITPIHLRVLLDLARTKVLELVNFESWDDLRQNQTVYDLARRIHNLLADVPHRPSAEAIKFLCSYNNVRRTGNSAAHTAKQEDIRVAVATRPLESNDRRYLEQMYTFIFSQPV